MLSFKKVNIAAIIFTIFILIFSQIGDFSYWWSIVVFVIWILLTAFGSVEIRKNYFLKAYHHKPDVKDNLVAITLDDGPNNLYTVQALQLLDKYQAKATFFCVGNQIEKHPKILQEILNRGHVVGNHSYSHSNYFGFYATSRVVSDLKKNNTLIEKLTNVKPRFFRPPMGITNPNIAKSVKKLNLQTFGWSIRSFDTIAKNPSKVIHKVCKKIKKGDVILLHDTSEISLQILEGILQYLEQQQMKSVTLEKLFSMDAYEK